MTGRWELGIGQELDGGSWIITVYLLSLNPGVPRWDDSHDNCAPEISYLTCPKPSR